MVIISTILIEIKLCTLYLQHMSGPLKNLQQHMVENRPLVGTVIMAYNMC